MRLTDGFTPADLRRIVSDAKAMLMYDEEKNRDRKTVGEYILTSGRNLRELNALGYELPKSADDSEIVNTCCS
jgi:hypothetical protein